MTGLAGRQGALVAALTSGGPLPAGFDPSRVGAARDALLRKRAGEVAKHWPLLAAGLGDRWLATFTAWAATRPTEGSLRDGWDLARALPDLPGPAAGELAVREARFHYDGRTTPRLRRWPAIRSRAGCIAVQLAGRVRVLRHSP